MKKRKTVRFWFWRLEDGSMCRWAWTSLKRLREEGKPSPRATAHYVQVYLLDKVKP